MGKTPDSTLTKTPGPWAQPAGQTSCTGAHTGPAGRFGRRGYEAEILAFIVDAAGAGKPHNTHTKPAEGHANTKQDAHRGHGTQHAQNVRPKRENRPH